MLCDILQVIKCLIYLSTIYLKLNSRYAPSKLLAIILIVAYKEAWTLFFLPPSQEGTYIAPLWQNVLGCISHQSIYNPLIFYINYLAFLVCHHSFLLPKNAGGYNAFWILLPGPEICTWLPVWEVRWLELKMFPKFPMTISCSWPVIYESDTENEREWGDYEIKSYRFLEAFVPSSHFQGWWTPLFSNPIQWLYFIFDWMKTCGKIRITRIIHNINNTFYYRELS